MVGRNVNIYFQEKTYAKIKELVAERKISNFVNEAVEEKLEKKKRVNKKKLIAEYKSVVRDKSLKEETKIWEGSIEDGIDEE